MEVQGDIQKRVLIVSQTFPPSKGIGGRRWAKFASYLFKEQVDVDVISAQMPVDPAKAWTEEVDGIPQYHYKHNFPKVLTENPHSYLRKLQYRLALTKAKLKADGTPYDRAIFDEKAFLETLENRLTEFIPDALIISGPPFNLLVYAAGIRERFPKTIFIADLRDPWLDGNIYGYGNLPAKALDAEKLKESTVVESFDLIVSPWEKVLAGFSERYPESLSKFKLLPHGWDKNDVKPNATAFSEQNIDLIYGGNLYKGFEPLLRFLTLFAQANRAKIEIYSSTELPDEVVNRQADMKLFNAIPVADFFARVAKSKQLLLLIPEGLKDGFPTKLLEFAATGKKIIAVGYQGTLSDLIVSKGLGNFVRMDEIESEFIKAYTGRTKHRRDKEWVEKHEMKFVTEILINLINFKSD